ncbi:MAG: thioredoxin family protein [Ignavibacteriales bacterium]|nr:thioredoxin family protein [Ignavibacteriales bacterium]
MKKFFLLLMILSAVIYAQEKNKLVTEEKSGKPMLIGLCDRTAFADSNFSWWFNSEYDYYPADSVAVVRFSKKLQDVKITIVMGTWCSDSRREIPRFYRILDQVGFNTKNLTVICVDRNKTAPDNLVEKLDIKLVPTIIFIRDDKEIGRIVETPKETLETDLVKIIVK